MTDTRVQERLVGAAWPTHFNRAVAEAQQKNIEAVGMPAWSEADQTLARALQKEIGAKVDGLRLKVSPLEAPREPSAGTDDIGDISWVVPTVYLRYPSNIPNLPGHSRADGVAMATPLAHKGATAGAKVQAMTALDLLLSPPLVQAAWDYFRNVQTKDVKYESFLGPDDRPPVELNREKRERWEPELRKYFFDPSRHKTYLEQLGIPYPTVR
jgi:aminobenzoyl-glutamate utilization protein B